MLLAERIRLSDGDVTLTWRLLLPFLAVVFGLFLQYTDIDLWLERFFYSASSHRWPWHDHWLTERILHEGGRDFVAMVGVVLILCLLLSFVVRPLAENRKLILCSIFAMAIGPVVVGYFKGITHISSPWDLALFGGDREYIRFFDPVAQNAPIGHAFPAGHASGGFSLVALFFAAERVAPRLKGILLYGSIALGLVFGFAQQMRGAHFLSHDLFALAVCWLGAWLVFILFYGSQALGIESPERA